MHDARRAEAHLQGLLRDIGLERRAKPVPDLGSYLAAKATPAGEAKVEDLIEEASGDPEAEG